MGAPKIVLAANDSGERRHRQLGGDGAERQRRRQMLGIGVVAMIDRRPGAGERPEEQRHGDEKPQSPTRLTTNAFMPARALLRLGVPEADEQVAAEADAFPAEEERDEAVAEDEQQHRRTTNRLR